MRRHPGDAAHTRGVLIVHSCTRALAPHVAWALSAELGDPVRPDWTEQPAAPSMLRAELRWAGPVGTAARLASRLRDYPVRFEVTEDACAEARTEAERYSGTAALGIHRATLGPHGAVMVSEERLRAAMARTASLLAADDPDASLSAELELLLGAPWDAELEPYRTAGDGLPRPALRAVSG